VPRSWGFWTSYKLEILERYLDAFTTASKRSPEIVYLDLFAGEAENVDRVTKLPIEGSPRIALGISDRPFTRLRFFELEPKVTELRQALTVEFVRRDWLLYEDCNTSIEQALVDLRSARAGFAPTFAFIDPNGPHCRWRTLQTLAAHKGPPTKTKVELWMLFPEGFFTRLLPTSGILRGEDNAAITAMFGDAHWHAIWEAQLDGEIDPAAARDEYVNLMRWRLEAELGYRWTHQLEIRNARGVPLYHMIFATDSKPGHDIMSHLYDRAAREFPNMAREARMQREQQRLEEVGQYDLFSSAGGLDALGGVTGSPAEGPEQFYEHRPPEVPREHDQASCQYCWIL
jgi:three-Cys-motif partner protein